METATPRDVRGPEAVRLTEERIGLRPSSAQHATYSTTYVMWAALEAWLAKTPTQDLATEGRVGVKGRRELAGPAGLPPVWESKHWMAEPAFPGTL